MTRVSLVTRQLLADHRYTFLWFWVVVIGGFTLVGTILAVADVLPTSVWTLAAYGAPRYYLGVVGIMLAGLYLRVYVAHGITRAEFALGTLGFSAVAAVGSALMIILGYAVERPLYVAFDLMKRLTDPYPVNSVGDAATSFVAYTLIFLAYTLSGALVGAGYQRLGRLGGTLFIPVALVPAALTEVVFPLGWLGQGLSSAGLALPMSVSLSALVIAAGIVGGYLLLRNAPVLRTK